MNVGVRALLRAFALPVSARPVAASQHRSRRRLARASVWSGAAAFAALTIGLAVSLEKTPELRDPEFGHRLNQLRDWKAKAPDRPLVLLVGSSRTQMGVSPAAMSFPNGTTDPLVYNLGLMGATPTGVRFQLFRALDAGVRPDFVLAELFAANVGYNMPAERQPWTRPSRLSTHELDLLADDSHDRRAIPRQWMTARATPWYTQRLPLMSNWLPNWIPHLPVEQFSWITMDEYGYMPYPIKFETMTPEGRERLIGPAYLNHKRAIDPFRVCARPDRSLREIAERCSAEGIPLAFFRTPESPLFRSWYGPGSWEKAAEYVSLLSRETGVPVFPAPEIPEEEFADGHHLFQHGALKYSRWLADTHLKPWLADLASRGGKSP